MTKRIMKNKAIIRCKGCDRPLRAYNKSGFCHRCKCREIRLDKKKRALGYRGSF
jgi:Zn finger protein HypA/HybF involved in hydrogenase expression